MEYGTLHPVHNAKVTTITYKMCNMNVIVYTSLEHKCQNQIKITIVQLEHVQIIYCNITAFHVVLSIFHGTLSSMITKAHQCQLRRSQCQSEL